MADTIIGDQPVVQESVAPVVTNEKKATVDFSEATEVMGNLTPTLLWVIADRKLDAESGAFFDQVMSLAESKQIEPGTYTEGQTASMDKFTKLFQGITRVAAIDGQKAIDFLNEVGAMTKDRFPDAWEATQGSKGKPEAVKPPTVIVPMEE